MDQRPRDFRACAYAAITIDSKLLLTRDHGQWRLPGGRIGFEPIYRGLVRKIEAKTGAQIPEPNLRLLSEYRMEIGVPAYLCGCEISESDWAAIKNGPRSNRLKLCDLSDLERILKHDGLQVALIRSLGERSQLAA